MIVVDHDMHRVYIACQRNFCDTGQIHFLALMPINRTDIFQKYYNRVGCSPILDQATN